MYAISKTCGMRYPHFLFSATLELTFIFSQLYIQCLHIDNLKLTMMQVLFNKLYFLQQL